LWTKVKRCCGFYPNNQIPILNCNNTVISSPLDISNTIATSLANISSGSNYSPSFISHKKNVEKKAINFNSKSSLPYNSDFTLSELKHALQSTNKSSSGPDNISYPMVKNLSAYSLSNLLVLYNRIWNERTFPSSWRMATVIPILKPGKDPTSPLNYRPIALTNCLCKLLEKMVNSRLMHYLEINDSLSNLQSGFRRGRCTIDNIIDLETRIRNAFVKRSHLVSIFFDIEKAYDRTWRHGILRQLFSLDLRGNLPIFIQNFLFLRYFKVRVGNVLSETFIQEEGVPQGSVLSVTLFIIAIDNVLKQIPSSVNANLYVDDLHISCGGADMRFIERQLQAAVNKIVKWSEENGFTFSPAKTVCVHFCRKRGIHPDPDIHFGDGNINVSKEVKFLGVIFDSKLTFLPHILNLRKRCERSLNLLKVLSNTSWGADRTSLLKIYRAVIRSKLDYGCVVYGSARNSVLKKLDPVHHSALRICSGAFRTSPVESLYADCCEAPLDLRRKILSLHYHFRLSSHKNHPLHNHPFSAYLTRLYNHRPSSIPPFYYRVKNILAGLNFNNVDILANNFNYSPFIGSSFTFLNPFTTFDKASTADIVFQQVFNHHREIYSNYIPIYTDGSKCDSFVGCAYVIGNTECSYRLHPAFSIFSAEMIAIFKALEIISSHGKYNFIIYTDSLSTLLSLSSPNSHSHSLIFKILNLLDHLSSLGLSVLFCWVPSHVGIFGNERVDKAAKSASDYLHFELPYNDVKRYVQSLIHDEWQKSWDKRVHNKLHAVKPVITLWPVLPSRKHDVVLTRLRIGHTRFTHRHLLLGEPAPSCNYCHVNLSVNHILIECPVYKKHRVHFFCHHDVTLKDLLSSSPSQNIFNFLKNIGFYPHI
jgi:ribonuclease HI